MGQCRTWFVLTFAEIKNFRRSNKHSGLEIMRQYLRIDFFYLIIEFVDDFVNNLLYRILSLWMGVRIYLDVILSTYKITSVRSFLISTVSSSHCCVYCHFAVFSLSTICTRWRCFCSSSSFCRTILLKLKRQMEKDNDNEKRKLYESKPRLHMRAYLYAQVCLSLLSFILIVL